MIFEIGSCYSIACLTNDTIKDVQIECVNIHENYTFCDDIYLKILSENGLDQFANLIIIDKNIINELNLPDNTIVLPYTLLINYFTITKL
jgi:hypothetical protein